MRPHLLSLALLLAVAAAVVPLVSGYEKVERKTLSLDYGPPKKGVEKPKEENPNEEAATSAKASTAY